MDRQPGPNILSPSFKKGNILDDVLPEENFSLPCAGHNMMDPFTFKRNEKNLKILKAQLKKGRQ